MNMNAAELKYSEVYGIINGHKPTFHDITNSRIAFLGQRHGSGNVEGVVENAFPKIASTIVGEDIKFEDIVWATSVNTTKDDYEKLIDLCNKEELAKMMFEYNKQTISLLITNGLISDLFDNPYAYSAKDITNDYTIVITGQKTNHLTIDAISKIFAQLPVSSEEYGNYNYVRDGKVIKTRTVTKHTFNVYGKNIHVITGFNVFGGANKSDHRDMIINGVSIDIYNK